jgi:integrase
MSRIEIGSVFRRNDGAWIGKWKREGEAAWHQRRCPKASDEASARAELVASVATVEAPVRFETFGAWFEASYLPALPVTDSTRALYGQHWRTRCQPLAALAWDELDAPRLERWLLDLKRAPPMPRRRSEGSARPSRPRRGTLSPHYVRAIVDLIAAACRHAHALGLLAVNAAPAVRSMMPAARGVSDKARALGLLELEQLASCAKVPRVARVLYLVSALAMLRPGEARALRWRDVDLARESLTVRASARTRSKEGPTKSGEPRALPLHPRLVEELTEWRGRWRELYGASPTATDFVFASTRDRGRQAPDPVGFSRHCLRAHVPVITRHGLRHTGASAYRSAGVSIDDLRVLMGHRSGVTEHYARPTLAHLRREIEKLRVPECAAGRKLDPISTAGVEDRAMPQHSQTQEGRAVTAESVAKGMTFPAARAASPTITTPDGACSAPTPQVRRTLRLVRVDRAGTERHAVSLVLHPAQDPAAVHHLGRLLADVAQHRHGVAVQLAVQDESEANCRRLLVERARAAVVAAAKRWARADGTDVDIDERCLCLLAAVALLDTEEDAADFARIQRAEVKP